MTHETAESEWLPFCRECQFVDRSIVYATFPWLLDEACPNCGGTVWDPVPRDYQSDYDTKTDEEYPEIGDKLAEALARQSGPVSSTIRIRSVSRRRQRWWRLLPGKRCPSCGARVYRQDPDGHPSRVWWCREHGPLERP